ncbi:unnamed protein product [Pedinophyceae sp. YPF-701]|nr:unnamed protein product [Pedinophyceae sp. YPF-701]
MGQVCLTLRNATRLDDALAGDWSDWTTNPHLNANYTVQGPLGHGAFAEVLKAVAKKGQPSGLKPGDPVAIKVLHKKRPGLTHKLLDILKREAALLEKLSGSTGIPHVHEVWEDHTHLFMAQDLLEGGELFDHLVKIDRYTEMTAAHIFRDIVKAIKSLHDKGIVHRDIKPENILFTSKISDRCCVSSTQGPHANGARDGANGASGGHGANGAGAPPRTREGLEAPYCFNDAGEPVKPKLIDLGMAEVLDPKERTKGVCGSAGFIAPETLLGEPHDLPMDMYGAGVVLFMMLTGSVPYGNKVSHDLTYAEVPIAEAQNVRAPEFQDLSPEAQNILLALLENDPAKRLTANQALQHPWLLQAANKASLARAGGENIELLLDARARMAFRTTSLRRHHGRDACINIDIDAAGEQEAAATSISGLSGRASQKDGIASLGGASGTRELWSRHGKEIQIMRTESKRRVKLMKQKQDASGESMHGGLASKTEPGSPKRAQSPT